ncbi:MAG TPA: glutaredoxin domain-containing protein [Anaerolineae bacterium]|nr:glutaredoxin domain-containing protein [Anaerolineae bacterium]HNU04147.1 glutaredoxin domain-containing protein [Anaerolineae bacterium]
MTEKIVLYGNLICPMIPPVRNMLDRAGAAYEYIDISLDRTARQRVIEINQGYASVPTLVFADGSTLTEPKESELLARLEALGYPVPPATLGQKVMVVLQTPSILMFGVVFLAIGPATGQHTLTVAGGVLLAAAGIGRLPWALSRVR